MTNPETTEYLQLNLHGENVRERDTNFFGDQLVPKQDQSIRIAFQNINLLPLRSHHGKNHKLYACIKSLELDVFCISETGLCWQKLPPEDQLRERTRPHFRRFRTTYANNTTELPISRPRQYGGVATIVTDDIAHRVTITGRDPTGLGRWTWARIKGPESHIRIISAYRPVHSSGPETVYTQHERHFFRQQEQEPREDILRSLHTIISAWIQQGDHIILCMDANEDVRSPRMKSFSMELGLINPILNQHTNLPATCDKNSQRQSIDAIWTTPCLSPLLSGYLPFGSGCPSDHRVLWIDFPKDHFLGESPKLSPPRPRRLKASDPRLVDRYINLLLPQLRQHNLIRRLRTVQSEAHNNGWNPTLEKEYNDINKLQIQLRRQVETKVRKLRSGGIPWSPALHKHRDTILALWLLIKKRNRRQVSNRLILRTLEKTDLQDAYTKNYDELQHLLTNAFSEYKNTRAQAESLRDEFLPSLAQARADRRGTSYDQELQQLQ